MSKTPFTEKSKQWFGPKYEYTKRVVKARPLGSLFVALGLLVAILILGSVLKQPAPAKPKADVVKSVSVFGINESPTATFQAKVEKTGVIKIMAQAPGIVQSIPVKEGQKVWKGQNILSLASNYQGGNAASVQRQIAQTQYQNTIDTYDTQKDLIQKQRDVATTSALNTDKQQDIARVSNDDSKSLINAQQSQIDQMNRSLTQLQSAGDSAGVAALESQITQAQGGLNQLRSAQRSLELQSGEANPPAKLADLQNDIALKQLDLQEKSLAMGKEISRLQVNLAYVSESSFYPASPFAGVVERIYVRKGQTVNPGTILATVTSSKLTATAVLQVPENVAKILSSGEPSEFMIGDKKVAATPYYISSEATDGLMYSVFYDIPEEYQKEVTDGEYISVSVPVETKVDSDQIGVDTTATPFVPVDSVYQTQDSAFVLIVSDKKAVTKKIKLGKVFGNYVEVISGLNTGDKVITDRNVVAGDKVKTN